MCLVMMLTVLAVSEFYVRQVEVLLLVIRDNLLY